MNENYILKIVKPYLNKDNQLKEEDFEKLFYMLTLQEKYKVIDVLIKLNIEIIYPEDEENNDLIHNKSTKVQEVEKYVNTKNNYEEFKLFTNDPKSIKLSNEQLCVMYQKGNKAALEMLFIKNYRLIVSRVMKYLNKYNHKLDFDDLVQYGFIGMLKAAKKFDITKEAKFSTYSIHWIDQSILRSIADYGFTIRLPVHVFESINYLNRLQILNNFKTKEELIDYVNKDRGYSPEKIKELLNIMEKIYSPLSLNVMIGEDMETELLEFIPDCNPITEEILEEKILKEEIKRCLDKLNSREAKVLELRFGLYGQREMALEEIGKIYGVTRERIRQIEAKALRRLRHPSRSKVLRDFI